MSNLVTLEQVFWDLNRMLDLSWDTMDGTILVNKTTADTSIDNLRALEQIRVKLKGGVRD